MACTMEDGYRVWVFPPKFRINTADMDGKTRMGYHVWVFLHRYGWYVRKNEDGVPCLSFSAEILLYEYKLIFLTGDFGWNFAYFPLIFSVFSICRFSAHMFKEFAYFCLFLPKMVPHPCYKLKHGTHLPFFCPHVYGFCLFLPMFRSFST